MCGDQPAVGRVFGFGQILHAPEVQETWRSVPKGSIIAIGRFKSVMFI